MFAVSGSSNIQQAVIQGEPAAGKGRRAPGASCSWAAGALFDQIHCDAKLNQISHWVVEPVLTIIICLASNVWATQKIEETA